MSAIQFSIQCLCLGIFIVLVFKVVPALAYIITDLNEIKNHLGINNKSDKEQ